MRLSRDIASAHGNPQSAPAVNILVANNFVSDVLTNGSATVTSNAHGININGAASAGGYNLYHNTVNTNVNQATGTTSALHVSSAVVAAGSIDLRNNILANTQTAGATRFSVFSAAPISVFSNINYNDYFAANVGSLGGTARVTLGDWQVATAQDANSIAGDPLFVSSTDFHITAASPARNSGTMLTDVTIDFDGQARPNVADPPAQSDMGADEYYSPVAANYSIGGRVAMSSGRAAARVFVTISGGGLPEPIVVPTNSLGYFVFESLPGGGTYTVTVTSRRYTFAPTTRVITLTGDVSDANFTVVE